MRSASAADEVTMITGVRLHREPLRSSLRTSIPPILGRLRSKSTSAGHGEFSFPATSCKYCNASCPLTATRSRKLRPHPSSTSLMTNASVGLSSTSSTVWGPGFGSTSGFACWPVSRVRGDGEAEGRSAAGRRLLQPNMAAVLLHHALTDRQSDAAARIFVAAVEAFEQTEDLFCELRFNQ